MSISAHKMEPATSPRLSTNSYSGKSILITGVTGFLGKVILEKLLRSLPTVGKIHLLIRGSQLYPDAHDRLMNEVLTSSVFDQQKACDPDGFMTLCKDKLNVISGELTSDKFGLAPSDFSALADELDLIINSAASVNFREPLDTALDINTLSLNTIVDLACRRKVPVIHVSTCFVNGFNEGVIHEAVAGPKNHPLPREKQDDNSPYEVEPTINHLLGLCSDLKSRVIEKKQRSALVELGLEQAETYGWNDSYTFTKWLGEQVLLQKLEGQTLTIVRPAIVESTLQEPSPGWIEGVKVADAIIMAYAREKVTFFPGDPKAVIDIIPGDLVANSIIVAGAEALSQQPAHRIYQCSSSYCNPVTIKEVVDHVVQEANENHQAHGNLFLKKPSRPFLMVPGWVFKWGAQITYSLVGFSHNLQRYLGRTPSTSKLSKLDAAMKLAMVFSFYTRPRYLFCNDKLWGLFCRLDSTEQAQFPMDARKIDWQNYIRDIHITGLNQYALKPKTKLPSKLKTSTQAAPA